MSEDPHPPQTPDDRQNPVVVPGDVIAPGDQPVHFAPDSATDPVDPRGAGLPPAQAGHEWVPIDDPGPDDDLSGKASWGGYTWEQQPVHEDGHDETPATFEPAHSQPIDIPGGVDNRGWIPRMRDGHTVDSPVSDPLPHRIPNASFVGGHPDERPVIDRNDPLGPRRPGSQHGWGGDHQPPGPVEPTPLPPEDEHPRPPDYRPPSDSAEYEAWLRERQDRNRAVPPPARPLTPPGLPAQPDPTDLTAAPTVMPGTPAPVLPQPTPNDQPDQDVRPSNLLEYRASLEGQGEEIQGNREYFATVDRYGAAMQAVHEAYRNGAELDEVQRLEVEGAHDGLRALVAERSAAQIPGRLRAEADRLGRELTPEEEAGIVNRALMDEMSLGIVSAAVGQENAAPEEVRRRGNAVTRGLGRVFGNRWVRGAMYVAAGAGILVGALSGAGLAVAVGAGIGGITTPIIRRVARHFQGRTEAHVIREGRNTGEAVWERNNNLLQTIDTPRQGESYAAYQTRVHDALYNAAVEAREQNRTELQEMAAARRQVGFGQTMRDVGRGMLFGGGFAGWLHMDVGTMGEMVNGAEGIPVPTPEQIAQVENGLIQQAIANGNVDQLHAIPGLENTNMADLQAMAQANGGQYAWNGAYNITGSNSGALELLQHGYDGVQQATNDGLGITINKVTQANGTWFYKLDVVDPNGLVVMHQNPAGGYDVLPLSEGSIHGGAQAELFKFMDGGQIVTNDQALQMLGEKAQVTPEWLAGRMGETTERIIELVMPSAQDVLAGAAGGAAAAATGEVIEYRENNNPQELSEEALDALRAQSAERLEQYLQLPRTSNFVTSLPRENQIAFARMVYAMTNIPRGDIAAIIGMQADIITQLEDEDNA